MKETITNCLIIISGALEDRRSAPKKSDGWQEANKVLEIYLERLKKCFRARKE